MLITLSHLSETKLHCCDVAEDDVRAAGQSPSSCQSGHWMTEAWCSVSAPAPPRPQLTEARPGPARDTHYTRHGRVLAIQQGHQDQTRQCLLFRFKVHLLVTFVISWYETSFIEVVIFRNRFSTWCEVSAGPGTVGCVRPHPGPGCRLRTLHWHITLQHGEAVTISQYTQIQPEPC